MKLKLNYSSKKTITTADLHDACDPPLIFEVLVRPPRAWQLLYNDFTDSGSNNLEMAKELISMSFLTVTDGSEIYPLNTVADVENLQAAIENSNPGSGDEFCCNIAWSFGRRYYTFLQDHLGNSLEPLPLSNGSSGEKTQALVS